MKNLSFAFHYLWKSGLRSLPRVLSLTLGLTLGILLLSYVNYRFNYDSFLPDSERIYKVFLNYRMDNGGGIDQGTNVPLARSLVQDCAEVESATSLYGEMKGSWAYQEKEYMLTYYATDSLFFSTLDFGLLRGDMSSFEKEEFQIMLSESAAAMIFGDQDPVGQILKDDMNNPNTVVGIFKDIPYNTSLGHFDMLVSSPSLLQSSWNDTNNQTYVKVNKGCNGKDLEKWMNGSMLSKYGLTESIAEYDAVYMAVPVRRAEVTVGTRRQYMDFFSVLAILVLALCALNYTLLSISSLVNRSRTIAILRCTAASRKDIWFQSIWETLILIITSGIFTAIILRISSNAISNTIEMPFSGLFSIRNIWVTVAVILLMFLGAGLIPAGIFSAVPTSVAFRGISDRKKIWKQALLVFEMICVSFASAFLIVSHKQLKLMQDGDLGYNPKDMAYVSLIIQGRERLMATERDFESLPCVESAGTSYKLPVFGYLRDIQLVDQNTNEVIIPFSYDYVSDGYFNTMQMTLLDGKSFSESTSLEEVVVNREFLTEGGFSEPAVGQTFIQRNPDGSGQKSYTIIGVVENVRTLSDGRLQPIVYHSIRENLASTESYYGGFRTILRLSETNQQNLDMVQEKLSQYMTIDKNQIKVYHEEFLYRMRGDRTFRSVLMMVFCITSVIAIIGLTGYISDELRRRRREIAIRRVSGASLAEILLLIIREFTFLAAPSVIAGEVLAFSATRIWIQMFQYHINLNLWIFVLSGMGILLTIYVIETLLTLRIASDNPAKSLKTE